MKEKIYMAHWKCEFCGNNGIWNALVKDEYFIKCSDCDSKVYLNFFEDSEIEERIRRMRDSVQKIVNESYEKNIKK